MTTRSFATAVVFFLRLLTVVVLSSYFLLSSSYSSSSSSYEIKPKFWKYKSRYNIGYEVATAITTATNNNNKDNDEEELQAQAHEHEHEHDDDEVVQQQPILLLNGFGVGSFHQHRLIHELFDNNNNHSNHTDDDSDDDDNISGDNDAVQQQYQQQRKSRRKRKKHTTAGTVIYGIDYLGQGRSWPIHCRDGFGENEQDLQYSANTWCEQIIDFIETIILPSSSCRQEETETENNKDGSSSNSNDTSSKIRAPPRKVQVHLVGNSVGGHLAAHIAVRRPDLIASICLLNPTPVWGSKLPGWDGHLPPPAIPKRIGRYLFDRIRDLDTIESFLAATYSRPEAVTNELMNQIRACTLGNGGHAAFASIMWSPPVVSPIQSGSRRIQQGEGEEEEDGIYTTDFYDCLKNVSCDVLLAFGKDDPWCKPVFAKSMLSALEEREKLIIQDEYNSNSNRDNHNVAGDDFPAPIHNLPVHRYVEITNTGHCPNHESPKAVSYLVSEWIEYCSCNREINNIKDKEQQLLLQKKSLPFVEEWGAMTMTERSRDEIEVGWMDKIVASVL